MQALVYTRPLEMQMQEHPAPALVAGEVVLRIDAVGICGSDMHAFHGHDPRRNPGLVLGHEFAGTVLQSTDPRWTVGARVTGNPLITCGRCDYCEQGRNNLCANRTMVGMTRPGAFAEQMSIPGNCLIALPDGMGALQAALTEPAATALHALNLSGHCRNAGCWCWGEAPSACWRACCCATMAWPNCTSPRPTRCAGIRFTAMSAAWSLTRA